MQANLRLKALDSTAKHEGFMFKLKHLLHEEVNDLMAAYIRRAASENRPIQILEAGCGRHWPFNMKDIVYRLTGVDIDHIALASRRQRDLDIAILGDLRNVALPDASFDVIYSSFLLEHVDGAERVLNNFVVWLKPGGLLILTFPNRDSVFGLFTRITPLWIHVLYKKYIKGNKNAGKAGYPPYPTFYDRIISRGRFRAFADEQHLSVCEEYAFGQLPRAIRLPVILAGLLSFGKLAVDDISLMYVLEKRH
jgi:SAM-dependent methyltransferase